MHGGQPEMHGGNGQASQDSHMDHQPLEQHDPHETTTVHTHAFVGQGQDSQQPSPKPDMHGGQPEMHGGNGQASQDSHMDHQPLEQHDPHETTTVHGYAYVGNQNEDEAKNDEQKSSMEKVEELHQQGDHQAPHGHVNMAATQNNGGQMNAAGSPQMNMATSSQNNKIPAYTEQQLEEEKRMFENMPAMPAVVRIKFKNSHPFTSEIAWAAKKKLHGVQGQSCPFNEQANCDGQAKYRSYDGRCNNLYNPTWGSFGSPLERFMTPPAYEDGVHMPRGAIFDANYGYMSRLPSPRKVSTSVILSRNISDPTHAHIMMQFGQFLDHDLSSTSKPDYDCCETSHMAKNYACFNIDLTGDNFFHGNFSRQCMDFSRSYTHCSSKSKWQNQINGASSYIDGSMIYGVNDEVSKKLRSHENGMLKTHSSLDGFLPSRMELGIPPGPHESPDDFMCGDSRAQAHSSVLSMHITWMREHNRIAKELGQIFRQKYSQYQGQELDELIFQETRKIVVAELQAVVYQEFLPEVFGQGGMDKFGLRLTPGSTYRPDVNPAIRNEFSTAAYRFGHSMVQDIFEGKGQPWRLGKFYGDMSFATREGGRGAENEMYGCATQSMLAMDTHVTKELTQNLYNSKKVDDSEAGKGKGSDLIALNIQRGRDHGIPGYMACRAHCTGAQPIQSMDYKPPEISEENWSNIKSVYQNPDDIDLYVGGLSESPSGDGGLLGPTFSFILGKQFQALKDGDRFFFTHTQGPQASGLPIDVQQMIMQRRLSDIMCDTTTTIPQLHSNVFLVPNGGDNKPEDCKNPQYRRGLDFHMIANAVKL